MAIDTATALFELGKTAIEKIWPDPSKRAEELRKLEHIKQQGNLALLDAHLKVMIGQMEINKEEAKSKQLFIAGWRPAVGWIGALAFGYVSIIEPILRFVTMLNGYDGSYPEIDTNLTIQVLIGMLGLGVMRSFDKKNGVQTDSLRG